MARAPIPVAVAGTLCVSTSAVVMKLADTSASVAALGRCAFALPALGLLVLAGRKGSLRFLPGAGSLSRTERWLARLSGTFLAVDLVLWGHTISAIGAGLGTVVPNLQVVFVSLIGWVFLRERPSRSLMLAAPVMVAGLLLVGGILGGRTFGSDPGLGIVLGVVVAATYSVYIVSLRQASSVAPVTALAEATLSAAIVSGLLGLAFDDFRIGHAWPTLGWLVVLALTSQVVGWLLISTSMPRIPAWMIGVILLIQPTGSVTLGYLILRERPSGAQLAGVAVMLAGVLLAVRGRSAASASAPVPSAPVPSAPVDSSDAAEHEDHPPRGAGVEGQVSVEVAVARHDGEAAG
jgi:drug/metabolite transporter (DMT)-like permease